MIRVLEGKVIEQDLTSVVIDVGGIGYGVSMANTGKMTEGSEVKLYTHLAVRETALDLYGFESKEELVMFELLLGIPKIGPKSAIGIMSNADVALLKSAAQKEDAVYLTKMSGIGKKSAEKIVAALKDKFEHDDSPLTPHSSADGDVVDALITLGYSQKEARDALLTVPGDITDTNDRIKAALKLLGR